MKRCVVCAEGEQEPNRVLCLACDEALEKSATVRGVGYPADILTWAARRARRFESARGAKRLHEIIMLAELRHGLQLPAVVPCNTCGHAAELHKPDGCIGITSNQGERCRCPGHRV